MPKKIIRTSLQTAAIHLATLPIYAVALDTNPPESSNKEVDPFILTTVDQQLPEATAVNANYLNTDYDPYLSLNQDANVSLTFLDEGAGYKNSLGWLTFDENTFYGLSKGDIDIDNSGVVSLSELNSIDGVSTGWLFPNASEAGGGGSLLAGDTVQVGNGTLSAGTSVSFFLSQNSWTGGNTVSDRVLTGEDQTFYGLDFLNSEADFTSTFDSNLANSRHVAMIFADENREEVIMGFEDLNRVDPSMNDWNIRSDEDFNDAVFIVSADPADAFGSSNIATAPIPQLGQGALGIFFIFGLGLLSARPFYNTQTSLV